MSIGHSFSKLRCLLLPLIFLVLTGCATSVDDTQPVGRETSTTTEPTSTPTETPGATATPRPTFIPGPATTVITSTVVALPTTPVPMATATLTDEQKTENLAELMRTNGGCELPCWWGIMPGKTDIDATREDLTAKGFRWGEDNSSGMRVADGFGVFIEFEVEEAVVQSMSIGGDYLTDAEDSTAYSRAFARGWQRYSLEEILNRHGLPTRVLVYSPFRADPGGGPAYHLLVFYEESGIEIDYVGSTQQVDGGRYRACPDLADVWDISLFLYQPSQVDNVVERLLPPESVSHIAGPDTVYDLIGWQQATGTSLESFYEIFSSPTEEACFEFSAG